MRPIRISSAPSSWWSLLKALDLEAIQVSDFRDRLVPQVGEAGQECRGVARAQPRQSQELLREQSVEVAARVAGMPLGIHHQVADQRSERRVVDFKGGGNAVRVFGVVFRAAVAKVDAAHPLAR